DPELAVRGAGARLGRDGVRCGDGRGVPRRAGRRRARGHLRADRDAHRPARSLARQPQIHSRLGAQGPTASGTDVTYAQRYGAFQWNVPPEFNFGYDAVDVFAADRSRLALVYVREDGS